MSILLASFENRVERWFAYVLGAVLIYVLAATLVVPPANFSPVLFGMAVLLALAHPAIYVLLLYSPWRKSRFAYTLFDLLIVGGIYLLTGDASGHGTAAVYAMLALWGARLNVLSASMAALLVVPSFVWYLDLVGPAGSEPPLAEQVLAAVSFMGVVIGANLLSYWVGRLDHDLRTERELREEANQRSRELAALRQVSQHLATLLDLDKVLDTVGESALQLVHATDVHIFLYDDKTGNFLSGVGVWADGQRRLIVSKPRSNGLSADVVRGRTPIVIDDAPHHRYYQTPEAAKWQLESIAGFPLIRADHVLGVLNVAFDYPHHFSREEQRTLVAFADQAAVAVENARLYRELQTSLDNVTRLYAISTQLAEQADPATVPQRVVAAIAEALRAPIASMALMNEKTGLLEYAAAIGLPKEALDVPFRRTGFSMSVFESGMPSFIEDTRMARNAPNPASAGWGYRALACLPIQHGDKRFGVIYVDYAEPHTFTPVEKKILAIFASQTAVVLENARLFKEMEQRVEALNEG